MGSPEARAARNRRNGTTRIGLALARRAAAGTVPGPLGSIIAEGYRQPFPDATCFVIGDVIFCRRTAAWLLAPAQRRMLVHELRHTYQYARLGVGFWPLYFGACAWSYALTGNFGARNAFERGAGLADGGYADAPLRPALRALRFSR